jgi:thiamine pyrophosphokinase
MNKIINYIILADGEFPKSERTLGLLKKADIIVCCDGAVDNLKNIKIPDLIVGDMDSISHEDAIRFKDIIRHYPDQECNDMTKAFQVVINELITPEQLFEITILGATGKREDHTIGNISLLPGYTKELTRLYGKNGSIKIVSEYGEFVSIFSSTVFDRRIGTKVSIFSFDPTIKIISEGLVYPTENVIFDAWWKATLNVTSKRVFSLILSHSAPIIIYFSYDI